MEHLVHESLRLARGSLLRVEDGRGTLVYVWSGSIWITQERDGRDRYVGPGGWFRVESDGLTLIQALAPSTVALTSPSASRRGPLAALRARLEKLWRSDEPATAAP